MAKTTKDTATKTAEVVTNNEAQTQDAQTQDAPKQEETTQEETKQEAASTPATEATSEKLEALKVELVEKQKAFASLVSEGKFGSPEMEKAGQEMHRVSKEIEIEKGNIKKIEADRIANEKKNEKIAIIRAVADTAVEMYRVHMEHQAGRATIEQSNDANAAHKAAFDKAANEVTARFANSTPARGNNGEAKTGTLKAQILERYKALRAEGKTDTEARQQLIKVEGFNDGTVGLVVLPYLREIKERD